MSRPRAVIPDSERIFAENIAAARAARGWSLERLSLETGGVIGPAAIWKSERAGRRVTIGEANALCAALHLDIRDATHVLMRFRVEVTVETEGQ